ncbi:MAG: efflux RND transporter periplasmic adaptor subunit [Kiritimatiellae bacterium]|nr:efflux RND transporter periplasmic adaptor subunit [Kiritimatiellia bacterium]
MKHDNIPILSIAILASLAGCTKRDAESISTLADVALPVRTLSVTNAPFERAMTVQGTLEAVESATVSARIPGPLSEVCVDLGDKVAAGETKLFAVDSATVSNQVVIAREAAATARAHVAVAEANVAKAEAVAKKAVRDAERFSRLHGEERVSDNEWERAQTQRETAEADVAVAKASLQLARQQVSQAEAQLSIAERQLADATLYAPCDGIVAARLKEPGEQVGPGTPVVVVKGVKELKALAFLPAKHYAEVIPGETEVDLRAGSAAPVMAKVSAKSPAIDQRLRVFEIKALLPGSETAVPGAMADFHVVFERREGVSVPQEAVLSRAAGTIVFVAQPDGTAKEVPVRVGLRDSGRAEILSGLAPGDPVIVEGQTQLYDGRKIARTAGSEELRVKSEE